MTIALPNGLPGKALSPATLFFREKEGALLHGGVDSRGDSETEKIDKGEWYLCRFCRAKIVASSHMIQVNGAHRHTFANPHGKIFEISCFAQAPGCLNHGDPTTECTWFAGYAWRFSHCGSCFAHLGWQYQSQLAGSFFGLIRADLLRE